MKRIIIIIVSVFLLASCSNNSDNKASTMVSSKNTKYKKDIQISINEDDILNNLKSLCIEPRNYGTEGEKNALNYLNNKINGYGYITSIQDFPVYKQTFSSRFGLKWADTAFDPNPYNSQKLGIGKNLIAKRDNHDESRKTIYITAHYDTTKTTYGAMDNGSGVSTALEVANQLKNFNSPYNIVVVFFSAEEYFLTGSKVFVSNLTNEEKQNALGCINIDMVGEKDAGKLEIRTFTAENNILSTMLNNDLENKLNIHDGGSSDEASFHLGKIPSLTLADSSPNPERSKESDHIKYIDPGQLKSTANLICNFLINFKIEDYNNLLKNQVEIPSNYNSNNIGPNPSLPIKALKAPKGFTLHKINSTLIDNGYASKTTYYYENKEGKKFTILEQDSRFINPDTYSNFKPFKENDLNNEGYLIVNAEGSPIKAKYIINARMGEISGDISSNDALDILKSYYKNRFK